MRTTKIQISNLKTRCGTEIKFNFMRNFSLLFLIALLFVGANVSAQDGSNNKKRRKGEPVIPANGQLLIKTTPEAYPIFINGQDYGLTGSPDQRAIALDPGAYDVEIRFPNKTFRKTMTVDRGKNLCMCLNYTKRAVTRPCPYEVTLAALPSVTDGDNIVFTSTPTFQNDAPVNLNYRWSVTPATAVIKEGQGTSAITIDSTGLGGQTVTASLEVDTGYDDNVCRQRLPFSTAVNPLPVVAKTPIDFDRFDFVNNDALKARLDNFASALQQQPENQGYIIVYGKTGGRPAATDRLGVYALDYLTRNRKVDARRVVVVNGGFRSKAAFELYLVPPGADPPTPR